MIYSLIENTLPMSNRTYTFQLLLACLLAVSLTACDQSSQKIDFEDGSNLSVLGPDTLIVPNYDSTVADEYMIRAFSAEKSYTWSVSGVLSNDGERRDGEVLQVSTSTPGDFVISASTTIDGQDYSGTVDGGARYPTALEQASKYNLNVFSSLVQGVNLLSQLRSGLTAFGPEDAAFVGALDENGNGSIDAAEQPAPGVLAKLLTYHAAVDSLTTTEISNGQTVATGLSGEFGGSQWSVPVSFAVGGGTVTVNGIESSANVIASDIATDEGIVLHKVDGVLLPSSLVSINDQDVNRDTVANVDAVTVSGTFVHDGGFIALHEGSASGNIIGSSGYLDGAGVSGENGFHNDIEIELNSQLSDTTTVVAMPHRDSDGNQTFTFNPTLGIDGPYTRGSTSVPVIDSASVATP